MTRAATHSGGLPKHCPRCSAELVGTTKPGGSIVVSVGCLTEYCGFQAGAGADRGQTAMSVPRARRSAGGED